MEENKLQLVTFEQAKALKSMGFDWGDWDYVYNGYNGEMFSVAFHKFDKEGKTVHCKAPTVPLALKWFRDVKGYDYSIVKSNIPQEYSYHFLHGTHGRLHVKGYEAAESALLDELLKF